MWGDRDEEIGKKIKRDIQHIVQGQGGSSSSTAAAGDQIQIRRHNYLLGPPGTLNTVTPCAACKLLRRRCAEECPFSPYFSPHEPHKFAAVHKVFGASNVSKLLMEVPENQRADAANSLVYEANVRIRDPVYGCMGAIAALQQQIQALQAEVNAVRNEILLKYKYREAAATSSCNNNSILLSSSSTSHQQPHHHHLVSTSSGTVSVAVLPSRSDHHLHPPPPPPPIPLPSIVVVSSSSSTSSTTTTLYTNNPSTTTAYSSITCDSSVPYFDGSMIRPQGWWNLLDRSTSSFLL